MSINVYLSEKVRGVEGFTVNERTDRGQTWKEYKLPGFSYLAYEKGRWCVTLSEPTDPIPQSIADVVEEISYYTRFPSTFARRETGIYRLNTAEAVLEMDSCSKSQEYKVQIVSRSSEDLLALYRAIRGGTIRPEVSYEAAQGGLSHSQLTSQLADVSKRLAEALDQLADASNRLAEAQDELETMRGKETRLTEVAQELIRSRKFFISPTSVGHSINQILNDGGK